MHTHLSAKHTHTRTHIYTHTHARTAAAVPPDPAREPKLYHAHNQNKNVQHEHRKIIQGRRAAAAAVNLKFAQKRLKVLQAVVFSIRNNKYLSYESKQGRYTSLTLMKMEEVDEVVCYKIRWVINKKSWDFFLFLFFFFSELCKLESVETKGRWGDLLDEPIND